MKIHVDGGARGNPGPAAIGAVLDNGKEKYFVSEYIGETTNNVAEYTAMIRALEKAYELGETQVEVFGDSELVVKQVNGLYKVKNEKLQPLHRKVCSLLQKFDKKSVSHVRREYNKEADSLVNQALDALR